jgi:ATP-dependent RNA helicase DDX52/ROK1
LLRNLEQGGFSAPTPIQSEAIPMLLHGRDLVACAPTGSGKTLAFAIPMVQALKEHKTVGFRGLVVSPTKELATQIYTEFLKLSRGRDLSVCILTKAAVAKLRNEVISKQKFDILISTPLRLVEAVKEEVVDLSQVQHLVLDEADKLFEQGFLEQTDEIMAACTSARLQKALFSATMPSGVEQLANTIMHAPVRVLVGHKEAASQDITQKLLFTGNEEGKLIAIRQMIQTGEFVPPVIIFVQSIQRAKALFHELIYDKVNVDVIHGERTQSQRDKVIERFKAGDIWVLICTDVLSRGIDFRGVNLVVNYDVPQSAQSYVHRIGRTGRAGRRGTAVTFFTKTDDEAVRNVVGVMKQSGCDIGDWMLHLPKLTHHAKKQLKRKPVDRKEISTVPSALRKKRKQRKEMIEASKRRKTLESKHQSTS